MRRIIAAFAFTLAAASPALAAQDMRSSPAVSPTATEAPLVLAQRVQERVIIRERDRGPRARFRDRMRDGCTTVTTRRRLPNGNVVVRRVRRCG